MAISFLQVPFGVKVPGNYVEFNTANAIQGPSIQTYVALLIGQKLSVGNKDAGTTQLVTSAGQAKQFFGAGSHLAAMAEAFINANGGLNELTCIALDDGGAVKSAGQYQLTAPPTADGTLSLMIGGRRYRVPVLDADTEAIVIAKLVAEIELDADRFVSVAINATPEIMDIVAKNGGAVGNEIDIRENYFIGEELPAGLATTITAMGGITTGSGDPDITPAIVAMGEKQYHSIAMSLSDASNLGVMQTEMQDRWGPIRQNDGQVFYSKNESFSDHSAFLLTRNNEQETVQNVKGPTPGFMWAANMAAVIATHGQIDPARPFQTLALTQVLAPLEAELFSFGERDLLLKAGSSTYFVDGGGVVRIERTRTTRIENEFGALDEALADLNPKLTLSFIRFDYRTMLTLKYPRHKLADDGTQFGPGQAIVTPKVLKTEAVARFRQWENLGLVEGGDQFKRDLIVERNVSDVNRADHLLPPDLVNQLRVNGVQIGFLL